MASAGGYKTGKQHRHHLLSALPVAEARRFLPLAVLNLGLAILSRKPKG